MADRPRTEAEQKLEALLRAWGREYGEGYRDEPRRWVHRTASHPIAQSMQFGTQKFGTGKKVSRLTRKLVGRTGLARRRLMGRAAGLLDEAGNPLPVPAGFVDPIPCKSRGGGGGGILTRPVPVALQRVERAVGAMQEFAYLRALCVRVQYAAEGEHQDKVAKVNEKLRQVSKGHPGIGLPKYRDELTYGRVWLHGALIDLLVGA